MNDDDTRQHDLRPTVTDPAREPTEPPRERPEPVGVEETPEAVRAAQVARNDKRHALVCARGVEWVRPTDLMARHSATLAGRGVDFQAELARRARAPLAAGMRRLNERVRKLPPISAFGQRGAAQTAPVRSGVGMR
jgi:hypothetical protein